MVVLARYLILSQCSHDYTADCRGLQVELLAVRLVFGFLPDFYRTSAALSIPSSTLVSYIDYGTVREFLYTSVRRSWATTTPLPSVYGQMVNHTSRARRMANTPQPPSWAHAQSGMPRTSTPTNPRYSCRHSRGSLSASCTDDGNLAYSPSNRTQSCQIHGLA